MYRKSKAQVISDAVCGILVLVSILAFVLIGIFAHVWHPTWIIIVVAAIADGIISIAVNTYSNLHKENKSSEEKND